MRRLRRAILNTELPSLSDNENYQTIFCVNQNPLSQNKKYLQKLKISGASLQISLCTYYGRQMHSALFLWINVYIENRALISKTYNRLWR